ncbi:MAG: DUF1501 domain-containing protein, partial [Planctomycetaceae bacterium]
MLNHPCTTPTVPASRRAALATAGYGLGSIALASLLNSQQTRADQQPSAIHHAAKAKRVIFLFQAGAPSHLDLLDYRPVLGEHHGEQLPDSVRAGQRLTGMSGNQSSLPLVSSPFQFQQHGTGGQWFSEVLPHTAGIADELCVIRSMHTEAI